jgi:general secretion pathway protein D
VPFQSGISPAALATLAASGSTSATTTSAAYGASITREKVELKLTVKPHIGDGDTIRLEIDQQAEEIAGSNSYGPITSTRGQKTTVVAQDAQTLVLGGIMQDREIDSVSKVPLLGDIPILGRLFRHTDTTKTKVNLLVFLTPHIIRQQRDFQQVMDRKMDERRKLMEQFYGDKPEVAVNIDYTRKRGPLSAMLHALDVTESLPEHGGPPLKGDTLLSPSAHGAM